MKKLSLLLSLTIFGLVSFSQKNINSVLITNGSECVKMENDYKQVLIQKKDPKSVNTEQVLYHQDFSSDDWLDESTWPEGWSNTDDSGIGSFVYINADTTHTAAYTLADAGLIPNSGSDGGMMHLPADFYNCVEGSWPPEESSNLVDLDVTLETGWLDISDATDGVVLQFATWFRVCCNNANTKLDINVSVDGDNWTTLNGRMIEGSIVPVNATPPSDIWEANISSIVEGSDQVKIQFRMHGGDSYFWTIDEIKLLTPFANDLSIVDVFATPNRLFIEENSNESFATLNTNYSEVPANIIGYYHFGALIHQGGVNGENVRVDFAIEDENNESVWSETSINTVANYGNETTGDVVLFADSAGAWNGTLPNAHRFYAPELDADYFSSNNYSQNGIPFNFTYHLLSDNEDQVTENNFDTLEYAQTWGRYSYHWQPNFDASWHGDIGPFSYQGISATSGDSYANDFDFYQDEEETFKIHGVRVFIPTGTRVTFDASGNGVVMHPVIYNYDVNANGGDGGWLQNEEITSEPYTLTEDDAGKFVYLPFEPSDVASFDFQQGSYRIGVEIDDYNNQKIAFGVDKSNRQGNYHFYMKVAPDNTWGWYGPDGAVMIDAYTRLDQFQADQVGVEELSVNVTNNVNIYPNPSNGVLNIENVENSMISIYSITGTLVREFKNKEMNPSLDLSDLSKGTYLVKIVKENEIITKKITMGK